MKRSFQLFGSLFCLAAGSVMADSSDMKSPPPVYRPEGVTTQPKGVITPPIAPRVSNGADILLDVDFIWWKSRVSGLDHAKIDHAKVTSAFQFEPGFKVGLGLDLDHDGWDVYAEYTYLYQPWQNKTTTGTGNSLFQISTPTGGPFNTVEQAALTSTSSSRKSQFNILDLEFGRNFFISKRLTLRPNFGLKLAWMFERDHFTSSIATLTHPSQIKLSQNIFGVGIRAGIDTVWHFTRTFGMYGDLGVTTLWSNFHNRNSVNIPDLSESYSTKTVSQDILPVVEAGLGLTYMTWFCDDNYQFFAKAGWEEQIWINYNKIDPVGTGDGTGSLMMQGLTLKVGFVF